MLQALQTKAIDAKTLQGAAGKGKSAESALDVEALLEGQDFANELTASLAGDLEVKPVMVSPEQMIEMPSGLINNVPQPGNPEAINPKFFDPTLTQGVEELIRPKTTEAGLPQLTNEQVLQLKNVDLSAVNPEMQAIAGQEVKAELKSELTQALLKTPQIQSPSNAAGRTPAMEMGPSEIDPQLLNMEDFVAQKNMVNKKIQSPSMAYGTAKPQVQKEAAALGLLAAAVIGESSGNEKTDSANGPTNSQQFILNMMSEQGQSPKMTETHAPAKVFDMSHVKTDNPNQILNQISDYIVQAKAAKEPTVNMRVNHDDLGMIDITVSKTHTPGVGVSHETVAINIGAHSADGKNFFQQNSKDLFAHLTTAGINVSDLKVDTPSQTARNDFDMNHQGKQGSNPERHFGSEQNQRRHESERRQDLWNLLKDKDAA